MNTEGHHLILDIWMKENLPFRQLKNLLATALMKSGQLILGFEEWEFYPRGESGIFLIAMSHASIHTYPEHKYITVDVYSCDENFSETKFEELFVSGLNVDHVQRKLLSRGIKCQS